MDISNEYIKPFYIYSDKNALYIKNINEHTEKIANNISHYCANVDENKKIHICCLDTKGRLIHFYHKKFWRKNLISKSNFDIKNIKDIKLHITNNLFNIFIVEKESKASDLYKMYHFNFNISNYKVSKHIINNIFKDDEFIYKLNIDKLSNIVLKYKNINPTNRSVLSDTLIFNSSSGKWLNFNQLKLEYSNFNINSDSDNGDIKENIFKYYDSVTYKI